MWKKGGKCTVYRSLLTIEGGDRVKRQSSTEYQLKDDKSSLNTTIITDTFKRTFARYSSYLVIVSGYEFVVTAKCEKCRRKSKKRHECVMEQVNRISLE
jgi:hypothetical protein